MLAGWLLVASGCVEDKRIENEGRACVRAQADGVASVRVDFDYCVACDEDVIDVGCSVELDSDGVATIDAWAEIDRRRRPIFCFPCAPLDTACAWPVEVGLSSLDVHYGEGSMQVAVPFVEETSFCVEAQPE